MIDFAELNGIPWNPRSGIPAAKLQRLQNEFEQWKEESRNLTRPNEIWLDNRPRFDIEPGHSVEKPALRRIASPFEISETCLDIMCNNHAPYI